VVIFALSGKFVLSSEKFWYVQKIILPLKWYTDRKFFGDGGGGGRSPKLFCSGKKIFASRAESEKIGQISYRPLIFSFRYAHVPSARGSSHIEKVLTEA
jgi:hypothetical protein